MKRKWFALTAIAAIAMVGMFIFENTAAAHRQAEGKRQSRKNNTRQARAKMILTAPLTALNHSWTDLTFGLNADAETLTKALPIYQETREAIQKQIKEAFTSKSDEAQTDEEKTDKEKMDKEKTKVPRKAGEKRAALKEIQAGIKETKAKFHASLKEILTEEQMTKLTELAKKRQAETEKRIKESRRNQRNEREHRRGQRGHRRHG